MESCTNHTHTKAWEADKEVEEAKEVTYYWPINYLRNKKNSNMKI